MSQKIKDIIDSKVRPAVAKDGGDIIFMNYKNGVVFLKLKGACSGCPSSTATLKQGIEKSREEYDEWKFQILNIFLNFFKNKCETNPKWNILQNN